MSFCAATFRKCSAKGTISSRAFAQRRDLDQKDADPIVKVQTKSPVRRFPLKITVGG